MHTHNPVWSSDGQWIYFVRGTDPIGAMDVWRVRPSGDSPEQLTDQNAPVNYLTPLDARTLLYVARAEDWSGPWLWALDVESRATRRVTVGQEHICIRVGQPRRPGRVVATVARPTASAVARAGGSGSACRGARCAALRRPKPSGPWRRASVGRRCFICRCLPGSGDGLFGFKTASRLRCGRAPPTYCSSPLRRRRTAAAWPSS